MLMKRMIVGLVASILTGVAVQAHHAFAAEFDATKPVRVQGQIVKVAWTNPHTWFYVDVKGPDGEIQHWMFEGGGPSALIKRGYTKDYMKIGTEVVVEGFLSKGVAFRATRDR